MKCLPFQTATKIVTDRGLYLYYFLSMGCQISSVKWIPQGNPSIFTCNTFQKESRLCFFICQKRSNIIFLWVFLPFCVHPMPYYKEESYILNVKTKIRYQISLKGLFKTYLSFYRFYSNFSKCLQHAADANRYDLKY